MGDAEDDHRPAPAHELAENATGSLAEDDAEDLARREAGEDELAALVGETSPSQATARGIIAAPPMPARKRSRMSVDKDGMAALSSVVAPAQRLPSTTMRSLPRASPSGPAAIWNRP